MSRSHVRSAAAPPHSPPHSPLPPRHPRQPAAMSPLQLPARFEDEPLPLTPGGPQSPRRVAAPGPRSRSTSPPSAAASSSAAAALSPRKLTNPTPTLLGKYRATASWIGIDDVVRLWEPFVATIETLNGHQVLLMLGGYSSVEVPVPSASAARQMQPEFVRVPIRITGAIDTSNLTASMAKTNMQGPPEEKRFTGTIEHPEGGAEREWQLKLRSGRVLCSITLKWIPDSPASGSSSSSSTPILSAAEYASTSPAQPHTWQLLADPNEGAAESASAPQPQSRSRSNSGPSSRKYQVCSTTAGNVSRASSPAFSSPSRTSANSSSSSSASSSGRASTNGRASPAAGRATPPRLLDNPLFEPSFKLRSQANKGTKRAQVLPWM